VHWLAYVCWPVALVHGLGTGTDTASVAGLALSLSCAVAVTAALWWRLSVAERGPARSWSAAAAVGLPVIIGLWLLQGPLAPGWAARAGTPSRLVASAATGGSASATNAGVTGATTSPPTPLSTNVATSLDGSFNGTVSSTGDGSAATLEIDAVLTDAAHDHLAVVLQGVNDAGNFLVRSGTVTITSTQGDARFLGQLSSIVGDTLYTSPTAHSPSTTSIAIQLASFDRNHGNASGSVRAVSSAPDREHREGDR